MASISIKTLRNGQLHYAWVVAIVTFLVLLVAAGVRTAPGAITIALETEFGWTRSAISTATAISLIAFGFGAPLAGSLVDRFGPKRIMLAGLALITLGLVPMVWMTEIWQLVLLWGLVVGVGTGTVANVLGATVAHRWFYSHRGLVLGGLGAASAAGQLVFVPSMVSLTTDGGWRGAITLVAGVVGLMLIPVLLLMRDNPEDVKTRRFGETDDVHEAQASAVEDARGTSLRDAIRTRDFWLLAGSFFVCGYTTNGLIQNHLLPHTIEHGFDPNATAGVLGIMGIMNIGGTLVSGWLSDRYDNRKLLATYYGFRALSLAALPFILEMQGLLIFAIIYGLDWVATVPPTINLTAQRFGRASLGTLYGWIFCSHMIGAALAAQAGGFFRDLLGDYHLIFLSAAVMGIIAVGLSLSISRQPTRKTVVKTAAVAQVAEG